MRRDDIYYATADCNNEEAHKELMELVQSDSELWQVLHHAVAYSTNECYLVIGDGRYLIAAGESSSLTSFWKPIIELFNL